MLSESSIEWSGRLVRPQAEQWQKGAWLKAGPRSCIHMFGFDALISNVVEETDNCFGNEVSSF